MMTGDEKAGLIVGCPILVLGFLWCGLIVTALLFGVIWLGKLIF